MSEKIIDVIRFRKFVFKYKSFRKKGEIDWGGVIIRKNNKRKYLK